MFKQMTFRMVPKIIISVVCRESIVRAVGHAENHLKILSASVTFDYHLSSVGVIYIIPYFFSFYSSLLAHATAAFLVEKEPPTYRPSCRS